MSDMFRCVDLHWPLKGGTMIAAFCSERAALAHAAELGLTQYKITIGGKYFRSEGIPW